MITDALLAGLPLPVLVVSKEGRVVQCNPAATDMFGRNVSRTPAIGLLRQAPVLAALEQAMGQGKPGKARFLLTRRGGEVTYRFHANPLPTQGAVLSFEDITQADEAGQIHRDFVANISHELRTPLTSLIGFIETLRGPAKEDAEARDRFLGIMDQEAGRMARMVSDLLSLSRVEVDARVRPRTQTNLAGVVRSVVATLEGKLSDANCEVDARGLQGKAMIRGDRDQLIQLFLNLLENAIKYGGNGKRISVALSHVGHDPELRQAAFRVEIHDEGPGIDPIHLPRLTERFYRVDSHRSRSQGGTGLGLAIVKHIVSRHRGRMKITSKQAVGSCFAVIFPAE